MTLDFYRREDNVGLADIAASIDKKTQAYQALVLSKTLVRCVSVLAEAQVGVQPSPQL